MDNKQKVIDTIAKLMTLAMNDGATDAEKDTAMRKAQQIMLKHNIAQAEVLTKEKVETNGAENIEMEMFEGDYWEKSLGWRLAETFDCKAIYVGHTKYMSIFGMKDDLDMALYFYNRLLRLITSMGRKAYPKSYKSKIRAYCQGVQIKVCMRLQELYKKVEEVLPSECRDIVVVKKAVIESKIASTFGPTKKMKQKGRPDLDALRRGLEDGDNVPLHSNRDRVKNSG